MLLCAVIITAFFALCKKLLPLGLPDCAADLPQAHLRNVAGGNAEGVDRAGRVKFIDMGKLVGGRIIVCPQAEACEQHIRHADLQRVPIEHLQIEVIQFLQQTVLAAVAEVLQVIRDIVRHGVVGGGTYSVNKVIFPGKAAEGSFQRLDDRRFKGRLHRPDGQRPGETGRMGIRHIEVKFQLAAPVIPEHGDTLSAPVDPAPKLPIPALHLQNRRGIRPLSVDQDLLVKGAFVVIAGGAEKARPAFIAAGDAPHSLVI